MTALLAVKAVSDVSKAVKGLRDVEAATSKTEQRLAKASKVAGATILAIGGLGLAARKEASALQQSSGAVEAAFGRQAAAIKKAAKSAATDLGLARSDYEQMSAVLGSQLRNLGVSQAQLVPQTKDLIKLGGDLAATFGGKTSEAVEALSSLMRGERDPIERYGVSIKQADINAQLAAKGHDKLTGAARKQAETEATLTLLMKQTAKAQGQRAREAGSDAQRAEVAAAKMRNALASLGAVLLPITAEAAEHLAKLAGWIEQNRAVVIPLIAAIAGLAAAVLVINGAVSAYRATMAAAQAVQIAFWAVMAANPLTLVIIAVVALAAAIVVAYKKSETFRSIVQAVGQACAAAFQWVVQKAIDLWNWIKKLGPVASGAKDIAVKAFNAYTWPIRKVVDLVKSLVGWIKKIKFPSIPKGLSSLAGKFGLGGPPADGPTTPPRPPRGPGAGVGVAPSSLGGLGGPGDDWAFMANYSRRGSGNIILNVTFTEPIDPDGAARAIEKLIRKRNVRQGAVI